MEKSLKFLRLLYSLLDSLTYKNQYTPPTRTAPLKIFPRVTGIRLPKIKDDVFRVVKVPCRVVCHYSLSTTGSELAVIPGGFLTIWYTVFQIPLADKWPYRGNQGPYNFYLRSHLLG